MRFAAPAFFVFAAALVVGLAVAGLRWMGVIG